MISSRPSPPIDEETTTRETDSDSTSTLEVEIEYHRPELKEFDPRMLSPPKPLSFKDKVRKRIQTGMYVLLL